MNLPGPAALALALAMSATACAAGDERRAQWQLLSTHVPGLALACKGEYAVTAVECLALGERMATSSRQDVPVTRVEVHIRPPGHRCDFSLVDAADRVVMSATGPCEP